MKKTYNQLNFRKVTRIVDLIVSAQNAKLTPPVGPVLGQFRIKVITFCENFNKETLIFEFGLPLKIYVYIYKDLSFNYIIKTPSTVFLIKNSMLKKITFSLLDLYKIVLIKYVDNVLTPLESILKSVLSTCKSMSIKV
jgi:large subunit ribosomal protein L11